MSAQHKEWKQTHTKTHLTSLGGFRNSGVKRRPKTSRKKYITLGEVKESEWLQTSEQQDKGIKVFQRHWKEKTIYNLDFYTQP